MATEKADVVIVGIGGTGGILAAELGKAGMKVIGLERGPRHATADFAGQDELRYFERRDLRPNPKRQPVSWRPNAKTRAVPLAPLNYGNQAGGGTVHYGAVSWRFHESDFRVRSQTIKRYGAAKPAICRDARSRAATSSKRRASANLRIRHGQPVERRFVSLRIDTPAQPLGHGGDGRVHTSDHWLWR